MHTRDPAFPPLLTGHGYSGATDPFELAQDRARAGKLGAGDVAWSRDNALVRFSIVLEPDVSRARAAEILPLTAVALGDCIGALTPPQVAVTFLWPGTILVNGAQVGEVKAALAEAADGDSRDAPPDWLVIGAILRLKRGANEPEPGHTPQFTTLDEEGCTEVTGVELIESATRHFLAWLHRWQSDGFDIVADAWMFRGGRW